MEEEISNDMTSDDDLLSNNKVGGGGKEVVRVSQMLSDAVFDVITNKGKLTAEAPLDCIQLQNLIFLLLASSS